MTGNQLKELLKRNKITYEALAGEFDVTRQAVGYWCNRGDEPIPKPWSIVLKQFFSIVNANKLDNIKTKEYD